MNSAHRFSTVLIVQLLCCCSALAAEHLRTGEFRTALDEYVAAADPTFQWKVEQKESNAQGDMFEVDLHSQTWRSAQEVDRPLWQHRLTMYVPRETRFDTALMLIRGGNNHDGPSPQQKRKMANLAVATQSVVVNLPTVPNQPLVFGGDGQLRSEDAILAYSWERYLETNDPTWIGQLPMVKSAVRAMDTVQQVLASENQTPEIKRFVVAGGSKRGWTTWLTAAVDTRVRAIMPLVIDVVHIAESIPHHHAAYGYWAPTLKDYVRHGLPDRLDDPECRALLRIVDPYYYRDRLSMPKYIINASGDEFFLPDSSRFYFDDLIGEKHLCYVPNSGHSLAGSAAWESLGAFYHAVLHERPVPQVSWKSNGDGLWTIRVDAKPREALVWTATNPTARDFRVTSVGRAYRSQLLTTKGPGQYQLQLPHPRRGWSATFAELSFDIGAAGLLRLTTPVWVTPDRLPSGE